MRNIQVANKIVCQTSKFTLNKLVECFQANPYPSYKLVVHKNTIHPVIDQNNSQNQSQNYGDLYDLNEQERGYPRKGLGLFANIIKNMEQCRLSNQQKQTKNKALTPKPKRQYVFYFNELKTKDTEVINRKSDYLQTLKNKQIQNNINPALFNREGAQYHQIKSITRQDYREDEKNIQIKNSSQKRELVGQMIDLNFSFDQINQKIQEQKNAQFNDKNDTIIHKYLNQNQPTTNSKCDHPQKIIDNISSSKQVSSPILVQPQSRKSLLDDKYKIDTKKSRKQTSSLQFLSTSNMLNQQMPSNLANNSLLQEPLHVLGATKAESRIYELPLATINQNKEVQIQFDLDLNFI